MKYLLDNPHDFTFDEVYDDYKDHVDEPTPVMNTDTPPLEIPESIADFHKAYNIYKLSDHSLSQFVVESLLSSGFREQILNRFSHKDNFEELPGHVYFMIAMDMCLASALVDIDGAKAHFKEFSLASYPGKNAATFSVVALKLIRIMKGAYSINIKIGCKILCKVDHTQSDYFNRKIYRFLDTTCAMESKYLCKDPKTMTTDADYAQYGPIGLCGLISKTYGDIYKEGDWPAVSATKKSPVANLTIPSPLSSPDTSSTGSLSSSNTSLTSQATNASQVTSTPSPSSSMPTPAPSSAEKETKAKCEALNKKFVWKYIKPIDENKQLTDSAGTTWYFCAKCACKFTKTHGFYNRTHSTKDHKEKPSSLSSSSGS